MEKRWQKAIRKIRWGLKGEKRQVAVFQVSQVEKKYKKWEGKGMDNTYSMH